MMQFFEVMVLTDFCQYWFHRAFHRFPFLWGFHAVHHSATTMDWLAGARMHFVEIVLLRGLTSLPLLTLGFAPSVMQAYVGFVYIYASLVHANLRGDFDGIGRFIATPRFHHWHHAIEEEAIDKNFAVHFPLLDRVFGTYLLPRGGNGPAVMACRRKCRTGIERSFSTRSVGLNYSSRYDTAMTSGVHGIADQVIPGGLFKMVRRYARDQVGCRPAACSPETRQSAIG
jgi:hypothetical protein